MAERLLPTGTCWCGCEEQTSLGAFFSPGHDKIAESRVILLEYGSVAEFIHKHGYGGKGKNLQSAWASKRR